MKKITLFLLMLITLNLFSQDEILDSIAYVREKNIPESAENFCTSGYWASEANGALGMFKQMCSWGEKAEIRLKNKKLVGSRAVLTVDFYFEGIPQDRGYLFMVKEAKGWLIDGMNENKHMIKYFLEGLYSGHFSPTELPTDSELADFGNKILSFGRNENGMIQFLEENTASGSVLDFTSQMTTDMSFELHYVNRVGYEQRSNLGYIHFKGKHKSEEDYYSDITIYVAKNINGKMKVIDRVYAEPYARGFFYCLIKLTK